MIENKNIDLLGIGNAITDILVSVDSDFLVKMNLSPGSMQLVNFEKLNQIIEQFKNYKISAGGSVANTISLSAALENKCAFIGKRKNDSLGDMFNKSMISEDIIIPNKATETGDPSSSCLVMITPDSQRTMLTFLGASTSLSLEDVDMSLLKSTKIVYLEGYMFDLPEAKKLFNNIVDKQKEYGFEVALSLSDSFCVERHKEDFLKLIEKKINILFGNEQEISSLYGGTMEEALLKASETVSISVCTKGEKGSTFCKDQKLFDSNAYKVKAIDTTGAGDNFAAGFLNGYIKKYPLSKCADFGNFCAAETVKVIGARLNKNINEKLKLKE